MSGFARYESYKDSDVEWLGEIPEHWPLQTIRAVTTLKSEKNRPDLQVLSVYREFGVILKDSRDDNHNATSLDTASYKAVNVGDLVVNKMKAWQGSMGISEHHGIVSPAYITCTVDSAKVAAKFLHYLLRSKSYIGIYNALSYGVRVGQWDMHYDDFKKIPIPLPSVPEQTRIANFLDQKTAEIDEAIAKKQRLIDLLQEQKAILINQAVTKGLNPDAPMRDSGVEWIGEIPAHWEVKQLKYLCVLQRGFDLPSQFRTDGTVPVYGGGGITGYHNEALISPPGVVTGRYGTVGEVFLVDEPFWPLNTSLYVKEFWGNYPAYVRHVLSVVPMKIYSAKSAVPGIDRNDVHVVPVAVPPIQEQKDIVRNLVKLNKQVQRQISVYQKSISLFKEFRQTLIADAVTGKIKI